MNNEKEISQTAKNSKLFFLQTPDPIKINEQPLGNLNPVPFGWDDAYYDETNSKYCLRKGIKEAVYVDLENGEKKIIGYRRKWIEKTAKYFSYNTFGRLIALDEDNQPVTPN